jgi:uncharacterized protein YjbI with pentapeptide repeats
MTVRGVSWRRVLVAGAAGVVLAGGLIAPTVAASPGDRIGTGKHTCVPGPGVNCRDVVHKWAFEHHGDLRGAKFARAKLHGADLRGARLDKANLRGVVLRHAHLHEASLVGANFSPTTSSGRVSRATPACDPNCQYADLSYADLSYANLYGAELGGADLYGANATAAILAYAFLAGASLSYANLTAAILTGAFLAVADLSYANLTLANLTDANLTDANLTGAIFCATTMPDGSTDNSGC